MDFPSISDTLHLRETSISSSSASYNPDFQGKSHESAALDKEMREIRDLNVSPKPPQPTRDSNTIPISYNSTLRKSISGTKADESSFNKKGKDVSFNREGEIQQSSNNRSVMPIDVQALTVLQDSLTDPIHFIEKGFQAKNTNST